MTKKESRKIAMKMAWKKSAFRFTIICWFVFWQIVIFVIRYFWTERYKEDAVTLFVIPTITFILYGLAIYLLNYQYAKIEVSRDQ